jgi:hypothetical protein
MDAASPRSELGLEESKTAVINITLENLECVYTATF